MTDTEQPSQWAMDLAKTLDELSKAATQGVCRVGADLIRIHPYTGDKAFDLHRNGFAKTIAAIGKEDGDWRDITQQCADAKFLATLWNAYRTGKLVVVPDDAVEQATQIANALVPKTKRRMSGVNFEEQLTPDKWRIAFAAALAALKGADHAG